METRETRARRILHAAIGVGADGLRTVVENVGSAHSALESGQRGLTEALEGRPKPREGARAVFDPAAWQRREEQWSALDKAGWRVLCDGLPGYPAALVGIPEAPPLLYSLGKVQDFANTAAVAIVGSRGASEYGTDQARKFGRALAEDGVCVVSGLARGVDEAAHRGAIAGGGPTIGVLGCGPDGKQATTRLAGAVRPFGALLSEFPPGTNSSRWTFPRRNRIVSGLSLGVLIVQAAPRSGTLITAGWALDQGREVLVLPGRVDHPLSLGGLALLAEGAQPVISATDLMARLGLVTSKGLPQPGQALGNGVAAAVVGCLAGDPGTLGDVCRRIGLPPETAMDQLVRLEMRGMVIRGPGGLYRPA